MRYAFQLTVALVIVLTFMQVSISKLGSVSDSQVAREILTIPGVDRCSGGEKVSWMEARREQSLRDES
jgi:hypothetical protein